MPSMTLEMSRETNILLAELQGRIGAPSKTEVIRRGIALLQLAADRQQADGTIVLVGVDEGGQPLESRVLLR